MAGSSVEYNNDYYKISTIINEWLADNDLSNHWYAKMLSFGLKGLRELSLHHWQEPISVMLIVDSRRTAILPENFVTWTKVGIKIGQYIKTLAVNGEMHNLVRSDSESTVESLPLYNMPNGTDMNKYGGYYFFNYNGNTVFGAGGGLPSKGHFNVVKRDNTTYEMTFDYDVREGTEIIMEYISDGFNPSGESVVNAFCHNYMIKVLDFKYEEKFNPTRTESSIHRMGQNLFDATRLVRASKNDLSPRTMLTLGRRETRMTPKI